MNIKNVNARVFGCDKPLLSSLSLLSIDIVKCLLGLKMKSLAVVDDLTINNFNNLFIDSWDVEPFVSDEPFFSSLSSFILMVFGLSESSYFECLVGRDGNGFNVLNNFHFDSWDIELRSKLYPFITSNSLLAF